MDASPTPDPEQADHSRAITALTFGSVAMAILPVVVATVRAIRSGWLPVSDDGLVAVRARDALSGRPPLLGMFSSASKEVDIFHNHPGPLLFDLLAVPARLSDGAGTALGAGLINGLAILGVAILAHRRGGPLLTVVSLVVTTALTWTMGSEVLYDPWPAHVLILPFLCFLFMVWSLREGDSAVLPFSVLVASLLLQSHLSYALLVPVLAAWGVAGLVLVARRRPPVRLRRPLLLAGVVGVVCWAKPLAEQFNPKGGGNLGLLIESAGTEVTTLGLEFGTQIVATVVSLPPWWLRPSFGEDFRSLVWAPPSTGAAVASLAAVVAVLVACLLLGRRRRDTVARQLSATALIGLFVAVATATRAPESSFGIAPHQFRWLWPITAMAVLAMAVTVVRPLAPGGRAWRNTVAAAAAVVAIVALLGLPEANMDVGPNSATEAIPVLADIGSQLGPVRDQGPVLLDFVGINAVADPYVGGVMAELQRRDIPFVVDDKSLVRHFFPSREFDGDNAEAVLYLRVGDGARAAPPGARRVAVHEGNTATERTELTALQRTVEAFVDDGRLRYQPGAEEGARRLARVSRRELSDPGLVLSLYREGNLLLADDWERRFRRYSELQRRNDEETLALFLGPLG